MFFVVKVPFAIPILWLKLVVALGAGFLSGLFFLPTFQFSNTFRELQGTQGSNTSAFTRYCLEFSVPSYRMLKSFDGFRRLQEYVAARFLFASCSCIVLGATIDNGYVSTKCFVVPGVINVSCLFVWVVVTVDDATDLLVSGVFSAIFVTMCVHSNLCTGLLARHALFS